MNEVAGHKYLRVAHHAALQHDQMFTHPLVTTLVAGAGGRTYNTELDRILLFLCFIVGTYEVVREMTMVILCTFNLGGVRCVRRVLPKLLPYFYDQHTSNSLDSVGEAGAAPADSYPRGVDAARQPLYITIYGTRWREFLRLSRHFVSAMVDSLGALDDYEAESLTVDDILILLTIDVRELFKIYLEQYPHMMSVLPFPSCIAVGDTSPSQTSTATQASVPYADLDTAYGDAVPCDRRGTSVPTAYLYKGSKTAGASDTESPTLSHSTHSRFVIKDIAVIQSPPSLPKISR
uniref:37S ribosomal protein YMR-31, mitochondrial n=1 Tax=Lygus hesperus TaxID=30085 RepID=A0A0A9XMV3_LYGHE